MIADRASAEGIEMPDVLRTDRRRDRRAPAAIRRGPQPARRDRLLPGQPAHYRAHPVRCRARLGRRGPRPGFRAVLRPDPARRPAADEAAGPGTRGAGGLASRAHRRRRRSRSSRSGSTCVNLSDYGRAMLAGTACTCWAASTSASARSATRCAGWSDARPDRTRAARTGHAAPAGVTGPWPEEAEQGIARQLSAFRSVPISRVNKLEAAISAAA